MSDLQEQVQRAIDELVESGAERGVQVAVYQDGEQVVDAVGGVADPSTGRRVESGTPFYNFSIGKGATSTIAYMLVERGLFDYDTRVGEIWPEFAAKGKHAVTVRHVLSHSAGVPGVPPGTTVEDLCDWDRMCAGIAGAELWWEPGTKVGYHAITYGYIVGEVVRRATGQPISQVLREEVAEPLGVARELYFGMPESEHGRLARLEDVEGADEMMASMPADLPMFKAGGPHLFPTADFGNRADVLAADIPAGGKTSARAIARLYAALVSEVDGVRLISPGRLEEATAVAMSGTDEVFGMPTTWGLGYSIGLPEVAGTDSATAFGVGGAGGSYAFGDRATGMALGLTKNRLTADFDAANAIIRLVRTALGS